MSKYPEKLNEVLETLSLFPTQSERIDVRIEYGEKFEEVPSAIAERPFPKENKVEYCESEAYVWVIENEGKYDLYFAVENPQGISAKALCAILQESLSGSDAETLLGINTDLVFEIFGKQLSMGKNLGLTGIIRMIQTLVNRNLKTQK